MDEAGVIFFSQGTDRQGEPSVLLDGAHVSRDTFG